jgi:hypothetical protein
MRRPILVALALLAILTVGACRRDPPPARGEGPASADVVDHLEEKTVEPATRVGSPTPAP